VTQPSGLKNLLRAAAGALPFVPRNDHLPSRTLTVDDVPIDRGNVADYAAVTGLRYGDTVPLTYPFALTFPTMMSLVTGFDFPFPAMGSVHTENHITQYRPIKVTVPGPFTMSQQAVNDFYESDEEMAFAYADAVREEIQDLFAAGADIVQLDEPWLESRPEQAKRFAVPTLERAIDGVGGTTALHVCFGYPAFVPDRPPAYHFLTELAATSTIRPLKMSTRFSNSVRSPGGACIRTSTSSWATLRNPVMSSMVMTSISLASCLVACSAC